MFPIIISLILSFLGFLDATYLTILHYKHVIPPCSLAHGCETVLTSQYATIGIVPIALLGSLFYLTLIVLLFIFIDTKKKIFLTFFKAILFLGIIVSAVLVYLQAFVIHAFCQYCLTSEGITVVLFSVSFFIKKRLSA